MAALFFLTQRPSMWLQHNSSAGWWWLSEEGPVGGGGGLLVRMRGSCRVQRTVLGLPNAAPGASVTWRVSVVLGPGTHAL